MEAVGPTFAFSYLYIQIFLETLLFRVLRRQGVISFILNSRSTTHGGQLLVSISKISFSNLDFLHICFAKTNVFVFQLAKKFVRGPPWAPQVGGQNRANRGVWVHVGAILAPCWAPNGY